MAELARIVARLQSLGQLGELVGALRSMAAARVREAQQSLTGTEAFRTTVNRAISSIGWEVEPSRPERRGKPVMLAITSENGFVGGFNTRIMSRVQELRDQNETLVLVGRRGQMLAQELRVPTDIAMPMTSRASGVTQLARRIATRIDGATAARIVFAQGQQAGMFSIQRRQVLPLAPVQNPDFEPWRPLHHLSIQDLMERLASEYLFAEIAHALMESLVSENNARLMTMDAASRNIDDRFEKLRRAERLARQEQTTSDMLDVMVGSEAVTTG